MSIESELLKLNNYIKTTYTAIGDKGGTIPANKNMANLPDAIASIQGGGGDNNWTEVMHGETTELYDNEILSIPSYFITTQNDYPVLGKLTKITFGSATTIDDNSFYQTHALDYILPSLSSFNNKRQIFAYCTHIKNMIAKSCGGIIGEYTFRYNSTLEKVDVGDITKIGFYAFQGCNAMKGLIMRKTTLTPPTLDSNGFTNSAIASGTCYIYVPKAMETTMKNNSSWSAYANQIRAIEDYSTDGTINGDINV